MSRARPETLLSYHALIVGSLVSNPATELDKAVNKLRTKYRSYIIEYDVEDGVVRLPNLFSADFGDEISRFATLIDTKENQFEVLVERVNGSVFFSKGWKSLRDFYGIRFGAWITLVFAGPNTFAMVLKNRFEKVLHYSHFVEQALDRARTNLRIVDECGNFWECVLVFDSAAFAHYMIGGGWRRFVGARNLKEGDRMRIGGTYGWRQQYSFC